MHGWLAILLTSKTLAIALWLVAIIALENRAAAAIIPLELGGYGGAWLRRWGRNLGLFALNAGLTPLFVLPVTFYAAAHPFWTRPDALGFPFLLPLDLVLLDLWIYWWHRANHEIPLLWRFHDVHHRDRFLDSTSALRFHFGEVAISAVARAPVILIFAIPLGSIVVFETLLLAATIFHHSNWRLPPALEARLARLIVTPSLHWVHHHARKIDTDSIYGTVFSFWDRLFGTAARNQRCRDMPIGVEGEAELSLARLVALPFHRN